MSWTHFGDTRPRARKRYRCRICDEAILPGEVHIARRGVDDGIPLTIRMHPECADLSYGWSPDEWENTLPGEFDRPLVNEFANPQSPTVLNADLSGKKEEKQ